MYCKYLYNTVNIVNTVNLIQFVFFLIYFKIIFKKKKCTTHELSALVLPGNTDSLLHWYCDLLCLWTGVFLLQPWSSSQMQIL